MGAADGGGGGDTNIENHYNIRVTGGAGADPEAIARSVFAKIREKEGRLGIRS
jgi:hypothetical protein